MSRFMSRCLASGRFTACLVGLVLPIVLSSCGGPASEDGKLGVVRQGLVLTPEVYSVSPPVAPTTGGILVTLTGKKFLTGVTVRIDGNAATVVENPDSEHVVVRVPDSRGVVGPLTVDAANLGGSTSLVTGTLISYRDSIDLRLPWSVRVPSSIIDGFIGDVNGNGKPDLILLTSKEIRVFLDNGSRTFRELPAVSLVADAGFMAVGDLDRDGRPDLVISHYRTNYVSTWRNDGSGGFSSIGVYPVSATPSPRPTQVVLADISRDGRLDAVVLSEGRSEVSILAGGGSCDLGTAKATSLSITYPNALAVADINRDGWLDVVVGGRDWYSTGALSIFLNDTKGALPATTSSSYLLGNNVQGLAVGDYTGDGILDLVATDANSRSVRLLVGLSSGAMNEAPALPMNPLPLPASPSLRSAFLADVDGDGALDIVVGHGFYVAPTLLRGLGAGRFAAPASVPSDARGSIVRVGDMDGDGKLDLVMLNSVSTILSTSGYSATPFYNQAGTWRDFTLPVGPYPANLLVSDLDGSHCAEAIAVDLLDSRYAVNKGDCSGAFTAPAATLPLSPAPGSCVADDINQDGALDFVCTCSKTDCDKISVRLGNGDGSFSSSVPIATRKNPTGIIAAHFNDPGWPDFVVVHPETDEVTVLFNKRTSPPAFDVKTFSLAAGTAPIAVTAGDYNGDTYVDLALISFTNSKVFLLPNNKMGSFNTMGVTSFATRKSPAAMVSADLNRDGILDLAIGHYDDGSVVSYLGKGDGTFPTNKIYQAPSSCHPSSLGSADWNRDSKTDLTLYCDLDLSYGSDPLVQLLLGIGDGNFGPSSTSVFLPYQGSFTKGDVDGDGVDDLVVAYGAAGGIGNGVMAAFLNKTR